MTRLGKLATLGVVLGIVLFASQSVVAADVDAAIGDPFGVARITVPFPPQDVGNVLGTSVYAAATADGRVLYPAFSQGFLHRILGGNSPPPASLTIFILFRGVDPLDVTIRTPTPQVVRVVPRDLGQRGYGRLLRQWWRYYNAASRAQASDGDYPPIVEKYLTSMLARRLGLAPPLLDQLRAGTEQDGVAQETLKLLAGAEELRLKTLEATSLGGGVDAEPARLPLPADIAWRRSAAPAVGEDVEIEPLAMHVPEECLYVRFGQFTNYLWLNQLLNDYGGDIGSMITARSLNLQLTRRLERQLCLKQSALAEVLGPAVIADVAIIGRDTYTREGAAIGILFQARNALLGADLTRQQNEALNAARDQGATRETVKIAGHDVSFIATPDNRLRSFYAVDGDYHLVTTSRAMVTRFFAVGQGERPLGINPEFRHARALWPTARDDTVFAFLSTPFLQGLLGPRYQIELTRRMRAVTNIELVKLARLAARGERVPDATIDQLVTGGFLPRGFGQQPDGSGPVMTDRAVIDSLRGARGSFLPIPDVPVNAVSSHEQAWYTQRAEYFTQQWQQLDPLMVALHRTTVDQKGRERLTIDASISPFDDTKFRMASSVLGPPLTHRVIPPADSIVTVEASVRGGLLSPSIPPHIMFLAIADHVPLTDYQADSVLRALQIIRTTPAVLGAWPKPGFLDVLPFNLGGSQPDANGFSQLLFGVWRWQGQGFAAISVDQGLLANASQSLHVQPTDDPAQIRIHAGDLSTAKFAQWLNTMMYERSRRTSVGNARFLNLLSQQLGVPPTEALSTARDLLEADMQCTLGGEYQLEETARGAVWRSTAWPALRRYQMPEDYQAPLLSWFRGLDARLLKQQGRLVVHGQIDMQRVEGKASSSIPLLDLLRGGNDD